MREVLGLERSDKLISELSIKGEIKKLPDELVKSLVLCDVKLQLERPRSRPGSARGRSASAPS